MIAKPPTCRSIGLLSALGIFVMIAEPASALDEPPADPGWFRILANGFVYPNPAYEYRTNGYAFDVVPGDNDMPWIREWANTSGLWNGVDMQADWMDREWEMMLAIIAYGESMGWTGQDSHPTGHNRRAKLQIEQETLIPEATWGCGTIAATVMGIAQAHGIPARSHSGANPTHGPPHVWRDICCSLWSTKYNKWVFFFQHCNNWVLGPDGLPMSNREIRAYDMAGRLVGWDGIARPIDGVAFMPDIVNRSNVTWITAHWWEGYFENQTISYQFFDNAEDPFALEGVNGRLIVTTEWVNTDTGVTRDVVYLDSLEFNYPQQQVQATIIQADENQSTIGLVNNMVWFDHYERSTDGGLTWLTSTSPVTWIPGVCGEILLIRGVGKAGEHSRNVMLQWYPCDIDKDCNGNGIPDGCEISFGSGTDCNTNGVPDECDAALFDCNTNGVPDSCEPDADSDGVPDTCAGDRDGDGVPDGLDNCFSRTRENVNPVGGPRGDINGDCVISIADYAAFETCLGLSGPGMPTGLTDCDDFLDIDGDGDVDLADIAKFTAAFAAP